MVIPFLSRWRRCPKHPRPATPEAAAAGAPEDAESQFQLGQRCDEGAAASSDYAQAASWYHKAAGQGHCGAQFRLGLLYGQGKGVVRDEASAVLWLRQAAALGHAGAQYHVGVRLYRASKARRLAQPSECRIEAFKWLQLATAQGFKGAQSAREFVSLGMSWEEVDEGGRRAAAFAPEPAQAASAQPSAPSQS